MSASPIVVVPVRDGVLPAGALDAVAEGVESGASVTVVGTGAAGAAGDLAGLVEHVTALEAGAVAFAAWTAALVGHCERRPFVLLAGSADGRDLGARLAAALGWPLLANAIAVTAERVTVTHHGGRLQSTVTPDGPFVATLQPGVRGATATGELVVVDGDSLDVPDATLDATVLGVDPPEAATMDLADASRIVGGGAGLLGGSDTATRFARLSAIGEAVGASMGATRVVTDAGWVGHDRQIGTTGVVVDPRLYLAFGISGAVQHTAGLGDPHHVISVNTDPHCPMMAMADLAVVADANAVLDELAERLGVEA